MKALAAFEGLALLVLAACVPETRDDPNGSTSKDEAACLAEGGGVVNSRSGPVCSMSTPDAGKSCTDGAQCSAGLCLVSGLCTPQTGNFGCIDLLEGGNPVTMCID